MKIFALENNRSVKTRKLFAASESDKVQKLRTDLEESAKEKFKEIDRDRSRALEEARKKFVD